jgi:hypothetical protein
MDPAGREALARPRPLRTSPSMEQLDAKSVEWLKKVSDEHYQAGAQTA